jgi:hypothetical protein
MTSDYNFQKAREAWGDGVVAPTHRVFQEWLNNPLTKALKQSHKTKVEELETRIEKLEALLAEAVWNYGELKRGAEKQEPVAWMASDNKDIVYASEFDGPPGGRWDTPLYTAPLKKEWVGLTNEERMEVINRLAGHDWVYVVDAIEAKLKERNS